MSRWKLLRVSLVMFMAVSYLFVPLGPQAKPPIDWSALAVIFLFIPAVQVPQVQDNRLREPANKSLTGLCCRLGTARLVWGEDRKEPAV